MSFTFTATGTSTLLSIGGTNSLAAAFRLDNVRVKLDGVHFGDVLTYSLGAPARQVPASTP